MSDSKKFVKDFIDFMKFCDEQAPESTASELKSYGLDPKDVNQKGRDLANELYSKHVQEIRAKIKNDRIAAQTKALNWISTITLESADQVDKAVQGLINGNLGPQAQQYALSYFKNFREVTTEDKLSLLKDIELLKYLKEDDEKRGI